MVNGKQPRHYALDYLKAQTKAEQKKAVSGCPKEWQELVRTHVDNFRERIKP